MTLEMLLKGSAVRHGHRACLPGKRAGIVFKKDFVGTSTHQVGKGIVGKKKGLSKGPKVRKCTSHVPSHK